MNNDRLTTMNSLGEIVYNTPKDHEGSYNRRGEYVENLEAKDLEKIITKLYFFEELYEEMQEQMRIYAESYLD